MEHGLIIAVLAGLGGMFGWGFADFFAKKTIDIVGDVATLAWAHIYGTVILLTFLVTSSISGSQKLNIPNDTNELVIIAFFGVLQAFVYYFAYKAFEKGTLSILNPIFSSYSGIVLLVSLLIFGELIGGAQLMVLLIVFVGVFTISLDKDSFKVKKLRLNKQPGVSEILIAVALAATWTVLWGKFIANKDWLSYAAIMYIFMTITVLLISIVKKVRLSVLNKRLWKYFMMIGLSEVVAYCAISIGFSLTTHLSIVAVLSAGFSLPTLILAYIFLGERINKFQLLGVGLIIFGITLLPVL